MIKVRDANSPENKTWRPTILDKINGKPVPPPFSPPPPPLLKSRMGKWRIFALRAALSLISGDGGLLFHFILSKIVGNASRLRDRAKIFQVPRISRNHSLPLASAYLASILK